MFRSEITQESIRDLEVEVHKIFVTPSAAIALSHLKGAGVPVQHRFPLILSHGVFVNRNIWLSLKGRGMGAWLARQGFDVWLLEGREHGRALVRGVRRNHTGFDELVHEDVRLAIRTVLEQTGAEKIFWIGHSHGGILIYAFLGRHPEGNASIAGFITLGTQTTEQTQTWRQIGRLLSIPLIVPALGYFPSRMLKLGPDDEFGKVMMEWFWWNWKRRWVNNEFDYQAALKNISAPLLCLAGAADDMANPKGCRRLFEDAGSSDKTFHILGRKFSRRIDYDHTSIIIGPDAEQEVWPLILNWMEQREKS